MSDLMAVVLAILLLLGNAFFVGAEFSLVSARRTRIEEYAQRNRMGARQTLRAMDRVSEMMAGAQLGITMCSLGLGALGEPAVSHLLAPLLHLLHVPEALLHPISFVVAMLVVVFAHMVLGEMVPKNMAIAGPERAALLLGPPMYWLGQVLRPVLWLLNQIANLVLRMIKVQPTDEVQSTVSADDVPSYLEESLDEGLLEDDQHQLMAGALSINQGHVEDTMIPTDRILALSDSTTPQQAEKISLEHGHSRFPVHDVEGNWVGYLHLKDLLELRGGWDEPLPRSILRDLVEVPQGSTLLAALRPMQRTGAHLAMVVDPDLTGPDRVVGWLMLEDVMEMMIGRVSEDSAAAGTPGPLRLGRTSAADRRAGQRG